MNMTVTEVLVAARALIEDPAHWCQQVAAKDAQGRAVWPSMRVARRWCALGAVMCVNPERNNAGAAERLLDAAAGALYGFPSTAWMNDRSEHAAVLRCYDHAIAAARAAEVEG